MFKGMLEQVRIKAPLVHSITNYVTVNDCANILLACGASPIMADDIREAAEITAVCNATVINIGTLNERTIESMAAAGKQANKIGHPVIFDPVGAGASGFRTETAVRLLREVDFTVIRGNISEIKTLLNGSGSTKGVDADAAEAVTEESLEACIRIAAALSEKVHAIVIITGAIDIIAGQGRVYLVRNGVAQMSGITGTGCMLTCLIAAFCAANPTRHLEAAALAVAAMGSCGEQAWARTTAAGKGTSSFRTFLIDEVSLLTEETLAAVMKLIPYRTNTVSAAMRLYAVTDRSWLGEGSLTEAVKAALDGGATFLQVREKEMEQAEFCREAEALKQLAAQYQVPFVVNDNLEVAARVDADGVHIGQEDTELQEVRRMLGPEKIIGVSVSTVEQALKAQQQGADYLGVGAVFPTATKTDAGAVSYDMIQKICQAVSIPVVAIGGITSGNISQLRGCGADGAAVVSALFAQADIKKAARELKQLADEVFGAGTL